MALDFPSNPTNGQVYGSYTYNDTVGAWQAREAVATVSILSPTVPATANNGDIWINTTDGISFVYYDDGDSAQWFELLPSGVPQLDLKADVDSPTFTGTVNLPATTSIGNVSSTELGYVDGVTSGIQAQIDTKAPIASPTFTTNATSPIFTSTATTGTAPLTVASTTTVTNLNADLLDGQHGSYYAPIASPTFTGTATTPTLSVTNNATVGGNLTVTGETYLNGTEIQGDGKTMLRYSDSWLRINEDNDFSSGIYAGTGILRTDGNLQVGSGGSVLNVSSSTFNYNGKPAVGLVPVTPTSVRVGTASVSSTGRVSVTSGTGFTLDGIFTSAYRNYKIIIDHRNMGGAYEYFRFIYGDNNWTTAGAYYGGGFYRQGSATGIWQNTGDGYSYGSIGYTSDGGYTVLDIMSPQWNGSYGKVLGFNSYGAGSHTQVWSDWMWNGWDAFTGIYIYNGGANYSAEVEVYGYNH